MKSPCPHWSQRRVHCRGCELGQPRTHIHLPRQHLSRHLVWGPRRELCLRGICDAHPGRRCARLLRLHLLGFDLFDLLLYWPSRRECRGDRDRVFGDRLAQSLVGNGLHDVRTVRAEQPGVVEFQSEQQRA
jgi:hypothetical protein